MVKKVLQSVLDTDFVSEIFDDIFTKVHWAQIYLVYASVYFCVFFAYTINIPRVVYVSNIHLDP